MNQCLGRYPSEVSRVNFKWKFSQRTWRHAVICWWKKTRFTSKFRWHETMNTCYLKSFVSQVILHHVLYMGVSKNNGTPQIIHFNRVFHYKPSILGPTPIFGNIHITPQKNHVLHGFAQALICCVKASCSPWRMCNRNGHCLNHKWGNGKIWKIAFLKLILKPFFIVCGWEGSVEGCFELEGAHDC